MKPKDIRPMLACQKDPLSYKEFFSDLAPYYPYYVSPKLDGIRVLIYNGIPRTRSGKLIPNKYIREMLEGLPDFDGELIFGDPTAKDCYNSTQSIVMSRDKKADGICMHVFDIISDDMFTKRNHAILAAKAAMDTLDYLKVVPQTLVRTEKELLEQENLYLEQGYEGLMIRDPLGTYKNGRSTWRERGLLKLKRFKEDECIVVGLKELMVNDNTPHYNDIGYVERSSSKANLYPSGMVGSFICDYNGNTIEVGGGNFTQEEKKFFWENQNFIIGRTITFRFFPYGNKEGSTALRFPTAIGLREDK